MSLGHTFRGALLNNDITPVGVIDAVVVKSAGWLSVVVAAVSEVSSDGQHSGRSSEHPINGT
jgi:hypothetical protein